MSTGCKNGAVACIREGIIRALRNREDLAERSRHIYLPTGLNPLLLDEILAEAVEIMWELSAIQEALQELA